jgi:hypothetical protein
MDCETQLVSTIQTTGLFITGGAAVKATAYITKTDILHSHTQIGVRLKMIRYWSYRAIFMLTKLTL